MRQLGVYSGKADTSVAGVCRCVRLAYYLAFMHRRACLEWLVRGDDKLMFSRGFFEKNVVEWMTN